MIGKFPIIFKHYLEIEYNRRRHLARQGPSSPVVRKAIVADLSKFTSEPDSRLILRIFVTLTTEPIVLKFKERHSILLHKEETGEVQKYWTFLVQIIRWFG